jgi:hypothetical protein
MITTKLYSPTLVKAPVGFIGERLRYTETSVQLSATDLMNMFTTPKTIFPAPGRTPRWSSPASTLKCRGRPRRLPAAARSSCSTTPRSPPRMRATFRQAC